MSKITKNAIADSLIKLMEIKPLPKITISNITEECGINRMTFYYYFQDIYDLLRWIISSEIDKIVKDGHQGNNWKDSYTELYRTAVEHRGMLTNISRSIRRERIHGFFSEITGQHLSEIVDDMSLELSIPEEKKQFIVDFYKYAIVGLEIDWIEDGMKKPPEILAEEIAIMVENQMPLTIEGFIKAEEK